MKKVITLVLVLFVVNVSLAQDIKTIALEQTKGEFTEKEITVSEGTYVFEISNNCVGHDVGFVLAPKGKTDQANHIKNAYVTKMLATGKMEKSNKVTLKKGEYVYFCPLNPTPEYKLIVK